MKIYHKNTKKWLSLLLTFSMSVMLSACGNDRNALNETVKTNSGETTVHDGSEYESGSKTEADNSSEFFAMNSKDYVTVFYPAADEAGLFQEDLTEDKIVDELNPADEFTKDEVTVEILIQLLSHKGVIPDSVSVLSENIKTDEDVTVLYLSLSSEYKPFILSLKDKNRELLYLASLTNTMIMNLPIDAVRLSVEGGNLITENRVYDEPLTYYDPEYVDTVWQGYQYELVDHSVMNDAGTFAALYPEFTQMEDVALMEYLNQEIVRFIDQTMSAHESGTEILLYEITYQDSDYVSILFRGERNSTDADHYKRYAATFNFDLSKATNRRLKDNVDIGHVIDCLELSMNYELVGESKITTEEFQSYLSGGGSEDFMFLLLDYDFDLTNDSFIPTGFTYTDEDEKTVLVMNVPSQMGYYVEIKLQ